MYSKAPLIANIKKAGSGLLALAAVSVYIGIISEY